MIPGTGILSFIHGYPTPGIDILSVGKESRPGLAFKIRSSNITKNIFR